MINHNHRDWIVLISGFIKIFLTQFSITLGNDIFDFDISGTCLLLIKRWVSLFRWYKELRSWNPIFFIESMKNLRNNSFAQLISEMRGRVNVIDASRLKSSFYCYVLHEISLNIGLCHTLSAYWYFWYFTAIKQSCEIIWMHNFSVNLEILFCAFLAVWSFQFLLYKIQFAICWLVSF